MSYTIAVPASSIQKTLDYGIPSITSVSGGVAVANGTILITSSYPNLPTVADPAYAQANVATGIATSSYAQANDATSIAEAAFFFANTIAGGSASDNVARILAQSAFNTANNAGNTAQLAYNTANAAYASSNTKVASITGTENQIIVTGSTTPTLSLPQNIHTTTNTFQVGSMGVGTSSSSITGEIRAIDNITAYYSSDENLKENIIVIDDALGKLKQVRGVMYDWKDSYVQSRGGLDDYFMRKHDTGIIAQEVEKVLPEVVANRPDGTKAVRYEKLAGIIIQAINELSEEIEKIKQKL